MTYLDTLNDTNDVGSHVCNTFEFSDGSEVWTLTRHGKPLPAPSPDDARLMRLNDMNWITFDGHGKYERRRCPFYMAAWHLRLAIVKGNLDARRCTSDDPTNHQGDTCPIHEADES